MLCSHMVFDRALECIGIYGITSLQEINQIKNKKEVLDIAVFHLHLHLFKARVQTRKTSVCSSVGKLLLVILYIRIL